MMTSLTSKEVGYANSLDAKEKVEWCENNAKSSLQILKDTISKVGNILWKA